MQKLIVTFIALVCLSSSAWAGVVYNFIPETPSTSGYYYHAWIEIEEEAWKTGAIAGDLVDRPIVGPVIEFSFWRTGTGGGGGGFDAESLNALFPVVGPTDIVFVFDLALSDDLTGSIDFVATDQTEELTFGGGGLWYIDYSGSDFLNINCVAHDPGLCEGASGRWVIDWTTAPVPEPSILGLLGFGLIAVGLMRRKRLQNRL